jgi:hypothetical protein
MRALLLILLLAGCSDQAYQITGVDKTQLAQCYTGALVGFCVVNLHKDQVAIGTVTGVANAVLPALGGANNGVASTLVGRVP